MCCDGLMGQPDMREGEVEEDGTTIGEGEGRVEGKVEKRDVLFNGMA